MKSVFSVCLLCFLSLQAALAEVVPVYCYPLVHLQKNLKDCSDNHTFVEAADLCLQKIDKEVQLYQAALAASMSRNNAAASDAQDSRITNNGTNLKNMQATLDALLASATLARNELVAYQQNLIWPGPLSAKAVRALGAERFLGQFSCFKESQKALAADLANLDGKIVSLKKTATVGSTLQSTTGSYAGGMRTGEANKVLTVDRTPAQAPRKPRAGAVDLSDSKVTGLEEDRKKQTLPKK